MNIGIEFANKILYIMTGINITKDVGYLIIEYCYVILNKKSYSRICNQINIPHIFVNKQIPYIENVKKIPKKNYNYDFVDYDDKIIKYKKRDFRKRNPKPKKKIINKTYYYDRDATKYMNTDVMYMIDKNQYKFIGDIYNKHSTYLYPSCDSGCHYYFNLESDCWGIRYDKIRPFRHYDCRHYFEWIWSIYCGDCWRRYR